MPRAGQPWRWTPRFIWAAVTPPERTSPKKPSSHPIPKTLLTTPTATSPPIGAGLTLGTPKTDSSHSNPRRLPWRLVCPNKKSTYAYDSQGRRFQREVIPWDTLANDWDDNNSTQVTLYLYDDWNLIYEDDLSVPSNPQSALTNPQSYAWGLDLSETLQGAGGVGGLLAVAGDSGDVYYPIYDHIGNIRGYVDGVTAEIVAEFEYSPFGETLQASGSKVDQFLFRFSTKHHDSASGLYYYGFRWYDSELGRWLNRDPIAEEGGLNLYAFVSNHPLNLWDILGLYAPMINKWAHAGLIDPSDNRRIGDQIPRWLGKHKFRDIPDWMHVFAARDAFGEDSPKFKCIAEWIEENRPNLYDRTLNDSFAGEYAVSGVAIIIVGTTTTLAGAKSGSVHAAGAGATITVLVGIPMTLYGFYSYGLKKEDQVIKEMASHAWRLMKISSSKKQWFESLGLYTAFQNGDEGEEYLIDLYNAGTIVIEDIHFSEDGG